MSNKLFYLPAPYGPTTRGCAVDGGCCCCCINRVITEGVGFVTGLNFCGGLATATDAFGFDLG